MKKADTIMKNILALVKDEYKELVEEKVKKATNEFVALSEDEQDKWCYGIGTIGYFFDYNHLDLAEDYRAGMQKVLINPNDEEVQYNFCYSVCCYLDCYLD